MQMNRPLVIIQCLVYNHEPYLRQCLDGFVMQKANFHFYAVVHDDCSTDNSVAIIREYTEKYPDIIHPIYETENQYTIGGFGRLNVIMNEACKDATYIAMCEGDDYWTDPLKLQKQVDFLEKNEEYAICGTNAIYDSQDIAINGKLLHNYTKRDFDEDDFRLRNQLIACTVMYRNYGKIQNFVSLPFGDWYLYVSILNKSHKKAFELDYPSANYRIHDGGVFSGASEFDIHVRHIIQIESIHNILKYPKDNGYYEIINSYFIKALSKLNSKIKVCTFGLWFFRKNMRYFPLKKYTKYCSLILLRKKKHA